MQKYLIALILQCSMLNAYGCTVIRFDEAECFKNMQDICSKHDYQCR